MRFKRPLQLLFFWTEHVQRCQERLPLGKKISRRTQRPQTWLRKTSTCQQEDFNATDHKEKESSSSEKKPLEKPSRRGPIRRSPAGT
ncbi:unnamed protein product [Caenorhabditis nigoni]